MWFLITSISWLSECGSHTCMLFLLSGHTPGHVPPHTPGRGGRGTADPTPGPGAAHDRGLVLTTGGEGGERHRRDGGDGERKGRWYWDSLMHSCLPPSSRSYSPHSRRRHHHSRSPFSNRKRHDGNRVNRICLNCNTIS